MELFKIYMKHALLENQKKKFVLLIRMSREIQGAKRGEGG